MRRDLGLEQEKLSVKSHRRTTAVLEDGLRRCTDTARPAEQESATGPLERAFAPRHAGEERAGA
jgi:hypothetical protein